MGRKSLEKQRRDITNKTRKWLEDLLHELQTVRLESLTIDDIALLSGKSKSTIYKYFDSKEDVILAACETRTSVLKEVLADIAEDTSAPLAVKYSRLLEQFVQGIADIHIEFLYDIRAYYPMPWAEINVVSDAFVALLAQIYNEGIDKGLYRTFSTKLLQSLDKHFVMNVITDKGMVENSNYTLDYLVHDYIQLRLYGITK